MKGIHNYLTIFVTSAYKDTEPISSFLKNVYLDKFKNYKLTTNPETADIIIFIGNSRYHSDYFFKKLKRHEFVKKYPDKVFMYNAHDKPWFILPGLYASMPKNIFDSRYMASTPYIETINPYIKYDSNTEPTFLYSFIGNPNSSIRRKIIKLEHPRGIVRASLANMFSEKDQNNSKIQYANDLADSKFVLCPRGAGTSSFRIFETMQAGRVPVIISDKWVRPNGLEWDTFALFVSENQVHKLPELLAKEESGWLAKSALARKAWEDNFAPNTIFNYLITNIIALKNNPRSTSLSFRIVNHIYFSKFFFRKLVIERAKKLFR